MKVSIIIPTYNKEGFIEETLRSALAQDYQDLEIIVVDDCSTDGTVDIIRKFAGDARVRTLFNDVNRGGNHCRNDGLRMSGGEMIIFLDGDDVLMPFAVSRRMSVVEREPGLDFYVFTIGTFRKTAGDTGEKWVPVSKNPLKGFITHKLPWMTMQPLWAKTFLEKLGGFDEQFLRFQDVEIHTRALLHEGVRYKLVENEPDGYYRISDDRRNYSPYRYNRRRVESVVLFRRKFGPLLREKGIRSNLLGPVFETYHQIIYHRRTGQLNEEEFRDLESLLLGENLRTGTFYSFVFKLMKFYNLRLPRIPGVNFLISKLIVS